MCDAALFLRLVSLLTLFIRSCIFEWVLESAIFNNGVLLGSRYAGLLCVCNGFCFWQKKED
jgi:hypothetical protein